MCKNPETTLTIKKKIFVETVCIACGHRNIIDPKHKLTKFILKTIMKEKYYK